MSNCPEQMAIIYYIIIFTFVFIGSLKSDCVNGTSNGCSPGEICYQTQCYPSYGPCANGICEQNLVCIADHCLNLFTITTAQIITTTTKLSSETTMPPCLDNSASGHFSDCRLRAYLCNNPRYYNLMTQQCPRTCNRCPGTDFTAQPPIPGCFDRSEANGKSNCASLAHLCWNLLYINLMKQQCPRTCKFC
uniref:ShKT domain-containing protein n=1 Tax=Onchocerca volvulus TaxID=6282 RepID=A0A2K6WJE2_ONCVO